MAATRSSSNQRPGRSVMGRPRRRWLVLGLLALLAGSGAQAGPPPTPPEPSGARAEPSRPANAPNRPTPGPAEGLDDFGRWEHDVKTCSITHPAADGASPQPETLDCSRVRLDQPLAGLLTLRFQERANGPQAPGHQLVITGVLGPSSPPMRCQDGRCDLQGPMAIEVSAMALASLDSRGLALTLPRAELVRGSCRIQDRRISCSFTTTSGLQPWRVEAAL